MISLAAAEFESIKSEKDLQRLCDQEEPESLYREFKTKADPSTSELLDHEKQWFSKAISGFANADGGVLLIGVATTKKGRIEHASKLEPICNAVSLQQLLGQLQPAATHHPVEGVKIEVVKSSKSGWGCLKCLVPASDRSPHRAALHKPPNYFRRSHVEFLPMEHWELEDAFGRRNRPVLKILLRLVSPAPQSSELENVEFYFLNVGRTVAKHAGFLCQFSEGVVAYTSSGFLTNATQLQGGYPSCRYYEPHSVVHPNEIYAALGTATIKRPTIGRPLQLDIRWYAEDMAARGQRAILTPRVDFLLPST